MPYTKTTDFAIKDTYLSGNLGKVVKGAEIDTEFENIETNFNSIGPLGTAAAATLTTTAADTTAGRVLKVGDFGLGADDAVVFTGDFNVLKTSGLWGVSSATTNGPSGWGGGTCLVIARTVAGGATFQLASDATSGKAWVRQQSSGVWRPWVEVWTTGNLVKTTSATDTTAGRVTKVGDFGLGTTAVQYGGDLNLLGNVTGFYRTVEGATNFPYGCLDSCFVHIGSGDTYSQTIVGYQNNRMYTRGGVGVVPNINWQPWVEVQTVQDSGALVPSLVNGFTDGGTFRYRKINGVVYITGTVAKGAAWPSLTTIFTLPVGFRPIGPIQVTQMLFGDGGSGLEMAQTNLAVQNTGAVQTGFVYSLVGTPSGTMTGTLCMSFPVA